VPLKSAKAICNNCRPILPNNISMENTKIHYPPSREQWISRTLKCIELQRVYCQIHMLTTQGSKGTHLSALPIGQEDAGIIPEIQLVQLESPAVLQHSILAITSVGIDEDPRAVLESNVLGFIFV
jgi:hypothetical protein